MVCLTTRRSPVWALAGHSAVMFTCCPWLPLMAQDLNLNKKNHIYLYVLYMTWQRRTISLPVTPDQNEPTYDVTTTCRLCPLTQNAFLYIYGYQMHINHTVISPLWHSVYWTWIEALPYSRRHVHVWFPFRPVVGPWTTQTADRYAMTFGVWVVCCYSLWRNSRKIE